MEVLDTTVANVALPHIAGSLSATTDEAIWVLTSYLVANAIVLPMTGWMGRRFGRRRFLLFCIAVFTAASMLCGAATSLGVLVFARVMQGAGGGALQPMSQAIMLESFPPQKRGQSMAWYGTGTVLAPILGPILGGWFVDHMTWRWVFFINLPVGIMSWLMTRKYVEDPPHIKNAPRTKMDGWGFSFLVLWLATLQIVLDKGQELDWFSSHLIVGLTAVSICSMIAFIWWELTVPNPVVNLRVLKDANFRVGTMLIGLASILLYGIIAMVPLFLQTEVNYPALDAGLAMMPRGLGVITAMQIVGKLIARKVDPRLMLGGGVIGMTLSSWLLTRVSQNIDLGTIGLPNFLSGLGFGFIMLPLIALSTGNLAPPEIPNAMGIFNLIKNLGGGIGVSCLATILSRHAQSHQATMVARLNSDNHYFHNGINHIQQILSTHLGAQAPMASYGLAYELLQVQSSTLAFVDSFMFMAAIGALIFPLVLIFRPARPPGPPPGPPAPAAAARK